MIKPGKLTDNVTRHERSASSSIRAGFQADQDRKRAHERAVANATKIAAAGPSFGSSTEAQPPLQRPVVTHGGS